MQYTPLVAAPQDWKILILGFGDKTMQRSTAWRNWYYSPPASQADCGLKCDEHLRGTAVFFRGFSLARFVYGAANHDILPPLVWLADSFPNATLLVENNPDASYGQGLMRFEKIKQFIEFLKPAKIIERGWTVCAESLKVLVPNAEMGHPEMLRSCELFRYMRQHMITTRVHVQQKIDSIIYPMYTLYNTIRNTL